MFKHHSGFNTLEMGSRTTLNLIYKKSLTGFTLIELLIVVAIIAILAAIAIPNFLAAQVRSKVSRVKAEQRTIATAIESYSVDYNVYPIDGVAVISPSGSNLGDYRVEYHYELSTPIAYLSRVSFRDPFGINATWVGYPVSYKMFNYKKLANPAMPPGRYFNWGNQVSIEADHDAWVVISYGPDQGYAAAEWFDYQPTDTEYWRIYDPSNGTVSYGDIIRLGGNSFHSAVPN